MYILNTYRLCTHRAAMHFPVARWLTSHCAVCDEAMMEGTPEIRYTELALYAYLCDTELLCLKSVCVCDVCIAL